ncbi:sensor histidine kinase [Vogesella sp. DC21W]|uniref:histidine kinase n=1 Tax=Vogesella aquatica TaxID=2984206 RepID=A0ABT5IV64_9NEIS|nr:sensor histidine kinase [Vogesella aquatica]MDC7716452.1 sensor histidine kinase [Vogesella aquatica]
MSQQVRLDRWFWQSFLRTALVPLLVVELGFLLIYWVSAQMIYQDNSRTVGDMSKAFMPREVVTEARALSERLHAVSGITGLFASQTGHALQTPYTPAAGEKARYQRTADGALVTTRDNGGAAAYYSGIVPLGPQQQTIDRSVQLDPVLKDIKAANPLIAQVYLNTKDSYNRIYPYFEVKGQYPAKMDIPSYNFYYEADGKHNPARKPVWTDAYLDPAGQGWMVSSIAPVWQGDTLQAVVGIDITLKTVVDELLALDLPWGAYVMLIGRDGTILALPPQGEHDWGLQELGVHSYTEAIRQNVFKPEKYRIDLHPEGKKLAALMGKNHAGVASLPLRHGRQEVVAWSRVAGPNWTLLMVAEEPVILAEAQKLHERMTTIGWFMLAALLAFYAVFFALLSRRARQMSQRVVAPLASFQQAVEQIGAGHYHTTLAQQPITELDALGKHIGQMAVQLQKASGVEEQARLQMEKALATERQINQQQQHFIEVLSHEVRTPLAQIDSVAQALQRRGSTTDADTLKARLGLIRDAGERLGAMLDRSLLALLPVQDNHTPLLPVSLPALLDSLLADGLTDQHIQRQLDAPDSPAVREPLLRLVVQELLHNAANHGGGQLRVACRRQGTEWLLRISDGGPALPADELAQLLQPFYRRSGDRAVGSGLGLTMVARFVDEMGGRLQLDSAEGEGLIVSVYLPLTEHDHV